MLEKGNTDVQVLFLSRTIFGSGSIIRRTHAMIFCFKGEKVSKCVKVFINWILSGVANRQYVIYGFFQMEIHWYQSVCLFGLSGWRGVPKDYSDVSL